MEGGPSHVDSFDYKPELIRQAGKPLGKGLNPSALLVPPVWDFKQRGQSGLWISELFPELAGQADRLCIINSMQTDIPAHPAAFLQLHTGISNSPRPSLGAWTLYGLGTENANLPGFVTICAAQQRRHRELWQRLPARGIARDADRHQPATGR